ncbi:UDP-N-acetylglucosamine 1-carboxyvinyltransferase [Candidatus Dojkabacteria bacterium]|nr:UDP-N-acetylglucosamine 1-carboxyvinyltransferase [Candidatus Dojkabacteria bacterium]
MSSIKIQGGYSLKGTVKPMPNKNSILKIIPAAILAEGPVLIHNVPKSTSVRILIQIFKDLGGKVSYPKEGSIRLDGSTIRTSAVNEELAMKERSSFMFLGPLISRFGDSSIKDGGGCKLGNRPLDTMFKGLEDLGVEIDKGDGYKLKTKGLVGSTVWLLEASVTGTENLVLAAVKAKGTTTIYNAACEPHTQDLCNFLNSIGARIQGIGTNKLVIEGVEYLTGGEWTIIADHIDVGGLIVTAAVTGGELLIKNAIPEHMTQIINNFAKLNLKVEVRDKDIFVPGNQELIAHPNIKGDIDKIKDEPWPGFPVDLIPQALILALKAKGNIRVYSNMYEVQLIELFAELFKMNSKMMLTNPNQIVTFGPTTFKGTRVNASTILQCTHALILAGLAAEGTTIVNDADIIYRRFPEIIPTLKKLGAKIEEI